MSVVAAQIEREFYYATRERVEIMNDQTAKVLTVDLYAWWKSARAGNMGPISVDDPQCGFYRVSKFKGGPLLPLAIFTEGGDIVGLLGTTDYATIERDRVNQLWPFAARNHVSEEAWREVAENGGKWPDIDATVDAQSTPGIGDNRGPTDPADVIKEQIESASAGIKEYAVISDDATRDRAQTLRSRLLELSGDADKRRELEKRPHFEASKAVDTKWQPLVKAAKTAADTIRAALSAWETVKFQRLQEAQRKAADAARAQYEEANKAMVAGKPIPPPPIIPPPETVMPTKFKGGAGRSASTSVVKTIKAVTDWPALIAHFQVTQEVRDLILELAKKSVKNGFIPPGVEIQDGVDVR